MRRIPVILAIALFAFPVFAVERDDCSSTQALAALYQVRAMMLKPFASSYEIEKWIDSRLEDLREPLPGGGYRWVRWVRPSSDAPVDKKGHLAASVQGEGDADRFEASEDHVYAVKIVVPSKRSLFKGNNAVYVGGVDIRYDVDGRQRTKHETINQWMNLDTSRTIDLGAIADHATVALDASTHGSDVREALVEIHFVHAVSQDDPENPAYPTVRTLQRARRDLEPRAIDDQIAELEQRVFGTGESLPMLSIVTDLRRADEMMRSKKEDEQEKGTKLMKETLRRLQ